jgi:hypothetical protein
LNKKLKSARSKLLININRTLVIIFMTLEKSLFVSSVLKGAAPRFSSEDKENFKILPKLRCYINCSHQIAFRVEEIRVKKFVCRYKPGCVC